MAITERTLKRWRSDSLRAKRGIAALIRTSPEGVSVEVLHQDEMANRILRLTQELLDIKLLERKN